MPSSQHPLTAEPHRKQTDLPADALRSLDHLIEVFESDIATQGVHQIQLARYVEAALGQSEPHNKDWFVELLRVWMEHCFKAGQPIDVQTLLKPYSDVELSERHRADLAFEYQRQRQRTEFKGAKESLANLPAIGSCWGVFELLEVLGKGAYSHVYLARQSDFADRLVALKLTFRETSEPAWLARLQHTAIVPVYATVRHDGIHGICMPYLGNTTLAELSVLRESSPLSKQRTKNSTQFVSSGQGLLSTLALRQSQLSTHRGTDQPTGASSTLGNATQDTSSPTLRHTTPMALTHLERSPAARQLAQLNPIETVLWVAAQVADGLAYAHRCGVIHCDLKPANILLGSDGQPRLLDFNVAYDPAAISSAQGLGGTPAYMAPEQWAAIQGYGSIDHRADIYSLGAVMYELLTGSVPPRPDSTRALREGDLPSAYRKGITPAVDAIVMRCLQPSPQQRYASADALYEDLQAQLQHRPLVHQAEPSRSERIAKWRRRHPRLSSWSAAITVASCVVVMMLVGWWGARERELNESAAARYNAIRLELPSLMSQLGTLQPTTWQTTTQSLGSFLSQLDEQGTTQDWPWTQRLSLNEQQHLAQELQQLMTLIQSSRLMEADETLMAAPLRSVLHSQLEHLHLFAQRGKAATNQDGRAKSGLNYGEVLQAIHQGEAGSSLPVIESWLRDQPRDYVGWLLKGMSEQSLNRLDQAEQAYSICIALDRTIPEGWWMRGELRHQLKRYESAEKDFSEALALQPNLIAPRLNRALSHKELKRYAEAIEDVNQVHKAGFRSVRTLRLLATLHRASGDFSTAKKLEAEAKRTQPISELDWIEHGLLVVAEDPSQAADDFQHAIDLNPHTILGYQNLAAVLASLGKIDASIESLDRLIEQHPHDAVHIASRAVLWGRKENHEAIEKDLKRLENVSVQDPLVMYQIGSAYSLYGAMLTKSDDATSSHVNARKTQEAIRQSIRWVAKSLGAQPSLRSIVESDPDSDWLRQRTEYHDLIKALYGSSSIQNAKDGR